ncbi:DUF1850 domain-containing protein [Sporosarcina sp. Marseille-Q4943]|uniref:DUF1850 domain-containing protein n=1 Tax=Sporosarcina sp. Marseille-Q4943 TaxID=2942204 RepID=UPI00208DA5CB|nr:DUF1850 domain-containing protein [Sporosarcina sp. Marseille-Q4943]
MSKSKIFLSGGMFAIMLLLSLFLIRIPTIQLSYMDGSFYLSDDTFELGWIHSVEKEPWFETYERKGLDLYLTTTKFKTFGAGVPSSKKVIEAEDGFVHMVVNEKRGEIRLAVSENVQTTLYTKNSEIQLYELVDDYETIVIRVVNASLWNLLRGEKID